MEREWRNGHGNGNGNHDYDYRYDGNNNYSWVDRDINEKDRICANRISSGKALPIASSPGVNYIEHHVSKFDTLAGVAIKYGVEVADIKKMNGLVTDLQMFALKSLQIPLPGRHPPSACLSNGSNVQRKNSSEQTPTHPTPSDLFQSFQTLKVKTTPQKVSRAMSSLQGYYGLKPTDRRSTYEGCEMAVYRRGGSNYVEDEPTTGSSPFFHTPLNRHRKSKSLVDDIMSENGEVAESTTPSSEAGEGDSDKGSEKLVRRRLKSVADFSITSEMLLKDDNGGSSGFSCKAGKGSALRPKMACRNLFGSDVEAGGLNHIPVGMGDSFVADGFSSVRKSSSTSSLQDPENGSSPSIWSTSKWSLKPDLQTLSTAAIANGLPKPITGRRNKTALD